MPTEAKLKYNFVFLFAESDYWKAILGNDLYHGENSRVYKTAFDGNPLLQKIFHYHWAYSLNEKIQMPFKSLWFPKMYKQTFTNGLPFCFVYMGGNMIRFDGGFAEYVRKRDPRNKVVIMHQDLIAKKIHFDYDIIRKCADLCITYDKAEAEKYGIHYFREDVYSKIIPDGSDEEIEQDVYFLGAAKDRLPKILAVYKKLTDNGIKCKFQIAGVNKEEQVSYDGVEYIKGISYEENLHNVVKSKCILELIQGASSDTTLRAREAIAYKRRLLTDCQLCSCDDYHSGQLQVFNSPDDIDISFITAPFCSADYPPLVDQNPLRRLYDIQQQLEKKR